MAVFEISGEEEMAALAARTARKAAAGDCFLLHGPLGAGKSAFARAFIRELCGDDTDVPSPTFTLVQTYDAHGGGPDSGHDGTIWHFDLYRLDAPEEIFEIGWEEAQADGITLVEWPERLGPYKPPAAVNIHIAVTGGTGRSVRIEAAGAANFPMTDDAVTDDAMKHDTMTDVAVMDNAMTDGGKHTQENAAPRPAPHKAFILAAGLGTRLRPYTDRVPKPMVAVAGKSIIHRTLEKLAAAGVRETTVNIHHLGGVLKEHLAGIEKPRLVLSEEDVLLNTGGGIKKAIRHFGGEAFYIINGDALWEDAEIPALSQLAQGWDGDRMDIFMLLQPVRSMTMTQGVGDYTLGPDGRAARARDRSGDYMFTGIRIAHPRIFETAPDGEFSFLELMDRAERQGRLYAAPHAGAWHHISTPADLYTVDAHLSRNEKEKEKA
ncbi:MAG: tRNA (adenosine(37)-N6)-threonylcarbamoyltransferase complex ATPase subunit type 1 TsaE [Micavibrio sp.]